MELSSTQTNDFIRSLDLTDACLRTRLDAIGAILEDSKWVGSDIRSSWNRVLGEHSRDKFINMVIISRGLVLETLEVLELWNTNLFAACVIERAIDTADRIVLANVGTDLHSCECLVVMCITFAVRYLEVEFYYSRIRFYMRPSTILFHALRKLDPSDATFMFKGTAKWRSLKVIRDQTLAGMQVRYTRARRAEQKTKIVQEMKAYTQDKPGMYQMASYYELCDQLKVNPNISNLDLYKSVYQYLSAASVQVIQDTLWLVSHSFGPKHFPLNDEVVSIEVLRLCNLRVGNLTACEVCLKLTKDYGGGPNLIDNIHRWCMYFQKYMVLSDPYLFGLCIWHMLSPHRHHVPRVVEKLVETAIQFAAASDSRRTASSP